MNLHINPNYTHRETPSYALDNFSNIVFQPDVYEFAHALMRYTSVRTLIDVGCGSGDKLDPFIQSGYEVVPVDHGQNLELFRRRHGIIPIDFDIEKPGLEAAIIDRIKNHPSKSLIVCADVIEHMVNPGVLLNNLRRTLLMTGSRFLIISTPDREKLNNPSGPPSNPAHVREWTMDEFHSLCSQFFSVLDVSYTTTVINLDGTRLKATIQVLATL